MIYLYSYLTVLQSTVSIYSSTIFIIFFNHWLNNRLHSLEITTTKR